MEFQMSSWTNDKRVQTSIVIPRPLRDRINHHAERYSTTMADILRMAATEYLARYEQKETAKTE
jgi:hypothetical protein